LNWDAIGAMGEIFGAIAVLTTVAYLAIQVRRSNELSRFSSSRDVINQFNELNRLLTTDSTLRAALMKKNDLNADEEEQVYNFAMMFCNVWMSVQIAHDNGQIEPELYAAGAKDVLVELDRWPNFRAAATKWIVNYPENHHLDIFKPIVESLESGSDA
jgi:hypothetical protein